MELCVLHKSKPKKEAVNIGGYLFLIIMSLGIYHLLLDDQLLSVGFISLDDKFTRFTNLGHILIAGLYPILLALLIFGTAVLSINIGSNLQNGFVRLWRKLRTARF